MQPAGWRDILKDISYVEQRKPAFHSWDILPIHWVNPSFKVRILSESLPLIKNFHKNILCDFFSILPVLTILQCEIEYQVFILIIDILICHRFFYHQLVIRRINRLIYKYLLLENRNFCSRLSFLFKNKKISSLQN